MAKIVVKSKGGIYSIDEVSRFTKYDEIWNERYRQFLGFIKKYGHQKAPTDKLSPNYTPENIIIGRWINTQRIKYIKGELLDWRYNLLVKADFIFDPYDYYWNLKYSELVEFKNKYGHCIISAYDKNYAELGAWIRTNKFRKQKLTPARLKKLEDIGIEWGIKRNPWDNMYKWLLKYYEETGSSKVPDNRKNGHAGNELNRLFHWCNKQTRHYRKNRLSLDKVRLLQELNFDFNRLETQISTTWERNFNKLLDFKNKNGTCAVPDTEENKTLVKWIGVQRRKKNEINPELKKRLDDAGFIWNGLDIVWLKKIESLKLYKEKYGHCRVFPSRDKKLSKWTIYIREVKHGKLEYKLSDDKIKQLEDLGFDWQPKNNSWIFAYLKLVEYKTAYGNCNVADTNENQILFNWCKKNRKNKDSLSEDKIALLNDLGFIW